VAKMAATVDHVSGGRFLLGLGAGNRAREVTAHGMEAGRSVGERLDWLDEAVEVMRAMANGQEATARGPRYATKHVRNDPPPIQRRLPILIGGDGEKKTLHTVAKYADAWNTGGDLEFVRHKDEVLRRWCGEVGRDESEIERTLGLGLVVIRDSADEARAMDAVIRKQHPGFDDPPKIGTSEEIAASLAPYVELGFRHILFDAPAPFDDETLERFVGEVKPMLEAGSTAAARR